jgi:hypothetical protein
MISRSVVLCLGAENAGEENLLVREFSKGFETIGAP